MGRPLHDDHILTFVDWLVYLCHLPSTQIHTHVVDCIQVLQRSCILEKETRE
jgi:hypothetical protein